MSLGKKDKDFVEGLKDDIYLLNSDIDFLRGLNRTLVKNVVRLTNDFESVASIDNLLNLSGLTVQELSNITGVNLEEFIDSNEPVTVEFYNSVLRSLFEFFLRHTD